MTTIMAPRRPRKRRATAIDSPQPVSDPIIEFEEPTIAKPVRGVSIEQPPPEPPRDEAESFEDADQAAAQSTDLN